MPVKFLITLSLIISGCLSRPAAEPAVLDNHSWWEGFSVSLLEAMASGCYPLVHFWNGAEEVVPKENIYIKNDELKEKVIEYYSLDEDQIIECSKKIRHIIEEKYSDNKQLKEIINIIGNL